MDEGDIFDSVLALEEEHYKAGETEGKQDGQLKYYQEGFVRGWQQACHVLQELGYIEGLLSSLLLICNPEIDCRLHNQCTKLLETVRDLSKWEAAGEEEVERKLTVLHTKTRFILQRLKISSKVINRSDDDF
ncbi:hypothetical protein Pcinc_013874 [Petrolisthes cinctipes]|uniref:Essential protein Yae1 N-terminal domain-containing protein n=1 Tax=Petrolisthes cinctipes TaxID=88211 RepID=A0AAE1FXQ3_PETCI|nr:hypothetical protein Pcinc_013874 [Petrolisthes cinctipes]